MMINFIFVPFAEKMAPISALDTLQHRILKRPYSDINQNPRPEGSRDPKFSFAPEPSVPGV